MKRLVKVFIIDDEPEAIELLSKLLTDNFRVEIAGTARYGKEALREVEALAPDIIFLDIQLPDMSGLDFCNDIRKMGYPEMKVVFYTGYKQYLIEALRREAFDFLEKPATKQDLSTIMARYYENKLHSLPDLPQSTESNQPPILVVNARNEHMTLRIDEIVYFRYNNDTKQWESVSCDHQSNTLRHRTTADAILNYSSKFIQTHKRYIVNIDYIKIIQETRVILKEPMSHVTEVRISKNYKRDLMNAFYNM